jgi:hypothetical protein
LESRPNQIKEDPADRDKFIGLLKKRLKEEKLI